MVKGFNALAFVLIFESSWNVFGGQAKSISDIFEWANSMISASLEVKRIQIGFLVGEISSKEVVSQIVNKFNSFHFKAT